MPLHPAEAARRIKEKILPWLTEAQELLPKNEEFLKTRAKLRNTTHEIYKQYTRLLQTFKENVMEAFRVLREKTIRDGEILNGLRDLDYYSQHYTAETERDTFECCVALHRTTKYLACDDSLTEQEPSKDDRFNRIHRNNYHFRRKYVAFLSEIVVYVEMVNAETTALIFTHS